MAESTTDPSAELSTRLLESQEALLQAMLDSQEAFNAQLTNTLGEFAESVEERLEEQRPELKSRKTAGQQSSEHALAQPVVWTALLGIAGGIACAIFGATQNDEVLRDAGLEILKWSTIGGGIATAGYSHSRGTSKKGTGQ